MSIDIIKEDSGYRIIEWEGHRLFAVIRAGFSHQVFCTAEHKGGGRCFASDTQVGMDYVAHWKTKRSALILFNRLVREAKEGQP